MERNEFIPTYEDYRANVTWYRAFAKDQIAEIKKEIAAGTPRVLELLAEKLEFENDMKRIKRTLHKREYNRIMAPFAITCLQQLGV